MVAAVVGMAVQVQTPSKSTQSSHQSLSSCRASPSVPCRAVCSCLPSVKVAKRGRGKGREGRGGVGSREERKSGKKAKKGR